MIRYVKLTSSARNHGYVLERYTTDGDLVDTVRVELGYLDKHTSGRNKLRIRKHNVWAIYSPERWSYKEKRMLPESYLSIVLPKFLR